MKKLIEAGLLPLTLCALSTWCDAMAAGGAHIVDDSEVERPGHCHVEWWVTRFVPGNGFANAAPACTLKRIPFLEAGVAHNLRPQDSGLGLGRVPGIGGIQAGLRYTPKDWPLDFDLLSARFLGEDQPLFLTAGVTVRF